MTKTPKGWEEHISHLPGGMYGSKSTRHLDAAIDIFKSDKGKRAKQATLVLTITPPGATLQGPRGKLLRDWAECTPEAAKEHARQIAARMGVTLEVVE